MEACWAHNPEVRGSKPRSAMFSFYRFCSTLFTIPKLSHQKELVPLQQQQSGAVEACWAHNPEVRGSKPRSAKLSFYRFSSTLFIIPKLSHQKELSPVQQQQSGSVEACWAHNPEVRGSKPRSAKLSFLYRFCSTLFTIPKLSHQKERTPVQQQQSGAVEAC